MTNLIRSNPVMSCIPAMRIAQPRAAVALFVDVTVHRLAEQRHFFATLIDKLSHFAPDVFRRAALLRAARTRHHAVGAKLIAADLNADVRLKRRRPHTRIARGVVADEARFDFVPPGVGAAQADRQLRFACSLAPSRPVPARRRGARCRRPCRHTVPACGSTLGPSGAMQPSTPMTASGLRQLEVLAARPSAEKVFSSACSRTEQVLKSITSASAGDSVSV